MIPAVLLIGNLAQVPAAAALTGQFLLHGQPITQVTARLIDYVGDCPGEGLEQIKGVSFLAPMAPAPFQRILITNQLTGGFTDREYDERRSSSEAFALAIGQGQHGSYLSVGPGENRFTYAVRDRVNNQLLAEGTAGLQVLQERVLRARNFSSINVDQYCLIGRSRDLNGCSSGLITVERTGVCPDGKRRILSQETVRLKK